MMLEVLLLFIVINVFIIFAIGIYGGYKLLHPKRVSPEEALKIQTVKGEISKEYLQAEKVSFELESDFNCNLKGFYIPGDGKRTIIFCHGISWNKYGNVKYLDSFLKGKWNIFMYDHRGAGESGKAYPSFGFYEKQDLKKVVKFARNIFPDSKQIGIFGESMGGSTAMQYAPMDSDIDFIVAVCPFASLSSLINYQLKRFPVLPFLYKPILLITNIYVRMIGKFSINDINPAREIMGTVVPLFLSHGKKDLLAPYLQSEKLFEQRRGTTVFFSSDNDGHTPELYSNNKEEFERYLHDFLKTVKNI